MKKHLLRSLALSLLLGSALTACSGGEEYREITAERIARPAFMVERKLEAGDMQLQLWERMHQRYAAANIYIEGDGDPVYTNRDPVQEPSPENPVALHLASRDNADNLGYIARPCQYKESPDEDECSVKYWSTRRFSPEVIAAYDAALDDMKLRYDIKEFNLIGYDGGANIAAALAAERKDVASIRTVAGDLMPDTVLARKEEKIDADSVRADVIAPSLANVPQHHFVGAGDEITPPSIYHSFRQAMGPSDCVHYTFVQDADHERGWVEKWPELLKATVACEEKYVPAPLPPRPVDKDASHGQK